MQISVPLFGQRDGRWAGQRLGTADGATIGQYGCAITAITMVDGHNDPSNVWNPSQMDNWFTNRGGYVDGAGHRSPQGGCDLVDWGAINRLLPNTSHIGVDNTPTVAADIGKLRRHLDIGGLAILQVYFNGNKNLMHFVTAVGYNGDDIIFNDPWTDDVASFASRRFGTGVSANDIIATHYFVDTTPNNPAPPPPVAPAPEPQPIPAEPTPDPVPPVDPPEPEVTPPPLDPVPPTNKPEDPIELPEPDPIPDPEPNTPPTDTPTNGMPSGSINNGGIMDKIKAILSKIGDESKDILFRALKTFVQSFAAVVLATNQPLGRQTLVAALAAAISAAWNSIKAAKNA